MNSAQNVEFGIGGKFAPLLANDRGRGRVLLNIQECDKFPNRASFHLQKGSASIETLIRVGKDL